MDLYYIYMKYSGKENNLNNMHREKEREDEKGRHVYTTSDKKKVFHQKKKAVQELKRTIRCGREPHFKNL